MRLFGKDYSQKKQYFGGTHRTRSPEETVSDYSRLMPRLGITRLANVTGLDCVGIPVYLAVRPNSRSLAVSQGKGLDVHAAKASALMESIELWHAEHIENPLRFESYETLRRSAPTVDIASLQLRHGGRLHFDRPMLWIEGWDLMTERATWVPFEFVNMNTVRPPGLVLTFFVSTNGLASGNHLLEATEHALSELIERDAVALHMLGGFDAFARRKLDEASVTDEACSALIARLRRADLDIAIWDITSHSGIPTFNVAIVDAENRPSWRRLGVYWGSGTHLSPAVALARALTEAAQSRLTIISGSRDDNPYNVYGALGEEALRETREALFAKPSVVKFGERPTLATQSFEGDVELLLEAIRRLDLRSAVVIDLSKKDIGVPVVKVVVPGLEVQGHATAATPGRRARERMESPTP